LQDAPDQVFRAVADASHNGDRQPRRRREQQMSAYAAEATWGVPGPAFLVFYLTVALTVLVLATLHRRALFAGTESARSLSLGPQQAAYLNGGQRLAVYTALGGLRAAAAIGTAGKALVQTSAMPAGITPLDAAIYNAAGRQARVTALPQDSWVISAITSLREGLEAAGLATTAGQRRTVRLWALAGFALVALGVLRVIAGIAGDRPVGFLIPCVIAVLLMSFFLLSRAQVRTRAGAAALADLTSRHAYLAPSSSPSYATYGASGAAMGVALYGTTTLYAMDPAFAAEAEIHRSVAGSSTGSGSTCSSSSCSSSSSGSSSCSSSSGSSCGGGGGCGG
jgi:uncharacterized protein (TIGR04222 family)